MTSPITHEKIIEVLAPFVALIEAIECTTDHEITDDTEWDINAPAEFTIVSIGNLRAARDLYQRLQAEKEGGEKWEVTALWVDEAKHIPPLNQEGGDAAGKSMSLPGWMWQRAKFLKPLASEFDRGRRSGIEAAAKWHDDQIASIEQQVAANNEYLRRHTGAMRAVVAANDSCSRHQTEHRLSATAIRALLTNPEKTI